MKYRIKVKKQFVMTSYVKYQVQAKYKYFPFWIGVSNSFSSLSQAEEYIELMLKEIE